MKVIISYAFMPANLVNDLTEATVEGRVQWLSRRKCSRF